jgi:hypothetical protein
MTFYLYIQKVISKKNLKNIFVGVLTAIDEVSQRCGSRLVPNVTDPNTSIFKIFFAVKLEDKYFTLHYVKILCEINLYLNNTKTYIGFDIYFILLIYARLKKSFACLFLFVH